MPWQEPEAEASLAHTGQLASIPGAEGHIKCRLWEAQGYQQLRCGHSPHGQAAVSRVPCRTVNVSCVCQAGG